jgi:hypothetical protein
MLVATAIKMARPTMPKLAPSLPEISDRTLLPSHHPSLVCEKVRGAGVSQVHPLVWMSSSEAAYVHPACSILKG